MNLLALFFISAVFGYLINTVIFRTINGFVEKIESFDEDEDGMKVWARMFVGIVLSLIGYSLVGFGAIYLIQMIGS